MLGSGLSSVRRMGRLFGLDDAHQAFKEFGAGNWSKGADHLSNAFLYMGSTLTVAILAYTFFDAKLSPLTPDSVNSESEKTLISTKAFVMSKPNVLTKTSVSLGGLLLSALLKSGYLEKLSSLIPFWNTRKVSFSAKPSYCYFFRNQCPMLIFNLN